MNSLEDLSADMYRELMQEIRFVRQEIGKVHDSLDAHVNDEMKQYAAVQHQLSEIRQDVVALKVKMGMIAAGVSAAVAAFTAWVSKIFFA